MHAATRPRKREGRPHEPPVSYTSRCAPKGRLAAGFNAICIAASTFSIPQIPEKANGGGQFAATGLTPAAG